MRTVRAGALVRLRAGARAAAGHAVLSLTTVRGEHAPPLLVDPAAELGAESDREAESTRPFIRGSAAGSPLRTRSERLGPMPPTLASLVQHSALKLTVRAGEDRLDTPVRWAHASELADPVPYMEGGELLLDHRAQAGRGGPRGDARAMCGGWPARASSGSASPSGSTTRRSPRRWSTRPRGGAAAARGAAPYALHRDQQGGLRGHRRRPVPRGDGGLRGAAGADRAALTAEGPAALLARLASQVDGWAALYDASGAVVATAPDVGGAPGRPAHRRRRTAAGPARRPRAPSSADRTRATTASSCSRWAPAGGPERCSPSGRPRRSAPPSATPCTRRSRC